MTSWDAAIHTILCCVYYTSLHSLFTSQSPAITRQTCAVVATSGMFTSTHCFLSLLFLSPLSLSVSFSHTYRDITREQTHTEESERRVRPPTERTVCLCECQISVCEVLCPCGVRVRAAVCITSVRKFTVLRINLLKYCPVQQKHSHFIIILQSLSLACTLALTRLLVHSDRQVHVCGVCTVCPTHL